MTTIAKLKEQYDSVCNEFVEKFAKKQYLDFDGWAGDEVGSIALFSCQYSFNIDEIILDMTTKQPKYLILQWQEDVVEHNMDKPFPTYINYRSYTMGLRYKDLKDKK